MTDLLVKILAKQDAYWLPCRGWANDQATANVIQDRRASHFISGAPWRTGKKDDASRKVAERELAELEKSGHVLVHRGKAQIEGVRLSNVAEQYYRGLCGFPTLRKTIGLLKHLAALTADGYGWDGVWIQETVAAGVFPKYPKDFADKLFDLQFASLPALSRGWLLSDCDYDGHAFYRIGSAIDATPLKNLPAIDHGSSEFYEAALGAEVEALKRGTPELPNNLVIGLPGSWPGESYPTNPEFLEVIEAYQNKTTNQARE